MYFILSHSLIVIYYPSLCFHTCAQIILLAFAKNFIGVKMKNEHKMWDKITISSPYAFYQFWQTNQIKSILSQPQQQHNTTPTQPQHCSWVWHENDCAHQPQPHPIHHTKLNGSLQAPQINIYWPQLDKMWPVTTSRATTTKFTTTTK